MSSRQRTLGHAAALMTIIIWGTTFVSTKVQIGRASCRERV